jgi:hypothetical protein
MTAYAGFDTDIFPGSDQMAWLLANTNLVWCGYYLAPTPSHGDDSWMGQRDDLADAGWGIAPVYVGQQVSGPGSKVVTAEQGTTDGNDATDLLTGDGFPPGSCVYLDLENGAPFQAPQTGYVAAWVAAVQDAGFQPGIYCSHSIAAGVIALCPGARIWAFKIPTTALTDTTGLVYPTPAPSGCGVPGAVAWQRIQNTNLQLPGAPVPVMNVDLDTALTDDPGAPTDAEA